jgi:predicted ester cyclase
MEENMSHKKQEKEVVMKTKKMIEAAKAPVLAYNDKNWKDLWYVVDPGIVYIEVDTRKRLVGVKHFTACMQEWATAFPDSSITVRNAYPVGSSVVLEITWHGTHSGPLESPGGTIHATGKKIDFPAMMAVEMAGEKPTAITHFYDVATLQHQLELKAREVA